MDHINIIANNTQSIIILLKISYMILPTIIPIVVPFCFITAATQILTDMNNNSELLIIDNTGTSRVILIRPVLFIAAFLSILLFISSNTIEPKCRLAINNILAQAQFNLIFSRIEENTLNHINSNLYIEIAKRYPDNTVQGIFIADSRDSMIDKIYYAQKGLIDLENKSLILQKGEIHKRNRKSKDISITKFDYYSTDMETIKTIPIVNPKAKEQSLSFLWDHNADDKNEYRSELHQRLTNWLYPIIFGMITILATERSGSLRNRSRLHPIFISFLLSFGFFWASVYISSNIANNYSYIPILYSFFACTFIVVLCMMIKKHTKI
ncbi:permease [Candidatus Liberibacter americanus PW_SP]|nr:permease [Candidatus Liberibacter americanus PW_SP]